MNMSFVRSIRLAAVLIFTSMAASALDTARIALPQADQGGLQISLATSGYKFNLSAGPVVPRPTTSRGRSALLPIWRDSFAASAVALQSQQWRYRVYFSVRRGSGATLYLSGF
jgi:hypothetical protein